MHKHYKQTNKQPARNDERRVIITSLILFAISTLLRHFGPGGASCLYEHRQVTVRVGSVGAASHVQATPTEP